MKSLSLHVQDLDKTSFTCFTLAVALLSVICVRYPIWFNSSLISQSSRHGKDECVNMRNPETCSYSEERYLTQEEQIARKL